MVGAAVGLLVLFSIVLSSTFVILAGGNSVLFWGRTTDPHVKMIAIIKGCLIMMRIFDLDLVNVVLEESRKFPRAEPAFKMLQ